MMRSKRFFKSLRSNWALAFSITILVISLIVGSYLRLYIVFNTEAWGYTPQLNELDPFSEYWIANNLLHKGLDYFGVLARDNSVTHIFWYPWGRDFTRSEPPMLTAFTVLTYYLVKPFSSGLTLYEWMVYLPVIFFIMTALGIYFAARELWGDIPAAVAVLTASLMFVSRHAAGFTVKYGIGLAFLFPAIYFHIRAWKQKSYINAVLSGIFIAFTAMSWAGFNILLGVAALQVVLLPFFKKIAKEDVYLWTYEVVPVVIALAATPLYGPHYLVRSVGAIIPASYVLLGIGALFQYISKKRELVISMPLLRRSNILYTLVLILIAVGGIAGLSAGYITLVGKGLAALGLTGLVRHVIVYTVQEYAPASAGNFINYEGGAIIVSALMLIYFAYRAIAKKDIIDMFLGLLFALSLYATINLSYFFPYMNYLTALISGSFIYVLLKPSISGGFRKSWFINSLAIVIVIFYAGAIIFQGSTAWARTYEIQTPMIINSGLGISTDAPAWLDTLKWINNSTPKDSVVAAWWDYGYWISVVGNRSSVADGSTLNSTQIDLLAKALTGTENEAYNIFTKDFHIMPDKLYIVAYEVYVIDPRNGIVYIGPVVIRSNPYAPGLYLGADAAKGVAAIYRIANRTPPIYSMRSQYSPYAYTLPDWTNESLRNATLFKILLDAAYQLWGKEGYRAAFPYDPFSNQRPSILPWPNMTIFAPAHISVSRILISPETYVVVSLYKVKGIA